MNLFSNTKFIEGHTLGKVFNKLSLYHYFSFFIFSDEIGSFKPSSQFSLKLNEKVNINKNNVLFVGDNVKADYKATIDLYFQKSLINTNIQTDDIAKMIKEEELVFNAIGVIYTNSSCIYETSMN